MAAVITSITGLQNLFNLENFYADWNGLSSINLSNLPNLFDVDVSDNDIPGTSINSLKSVNLSGSTSITELRLDDNDFSAGIPDISALTSLTFLDLNQCGISGILNFSGLPAITHIDVFGNPDLTSVIISNAQPITLLDAFDCGLTETAVDNILVALDDSGNLSGSVYLDSGTNAIPSVIGLAAKTSLEGKGWTVDVNS